MQSGRGLFREGVSELLRQHGFEARGYASHADLLHATRRGLPDLVLLDLVDGTGEPADLLSGRRAKWPEATVVAIGTPCSSPLRRPPATDGSSNRGAGARDVFAIAEAVGKARQGRIRLPVPPRVERELAIWESLTRRQRQVLGLLGCGLGNAKIAGALGISEMQAEFGARVPPVVFLTGAFPSMIENIAAPVMQKPVDIDQLMSVVGHHCPRELAVRT